MSKEIKTGYIFPHQKFWSFLTFGGSMNGYKLYLSEATMQKYKVYKQDFPVVMLVKYWDKILNEEGSVMYKTCLIWQTTTVHLK